MADDVDTSRVQQELEQAKRRIAELESSGWLRGQVVEQGTGAPSYGDLSLRNRDGAILRAAGKENLQSIAADYLQLLGTSTAVYEDNGDYALGIFACNWCRRLDDASWALCRTDDIEHALSCGRWLCHDACWDTSRRAMEEDGPIDVECPGGLRLFALPVKAGGQAVGAISVGYGLPPSDPDELQELARAYSIPVSELVDLARAHPRPPAIAVSIAKQRLRSSAHLLGWLVEKTWTEERLRKRVAELDCLFDISKLLEPPRPPLPEACQGIVDRLPGALGNPELGAVRLVLGDEEFATNGARDHGRTEAVGITVQDQPAGTLEVCCLREAPAADEGWLLPEERKLLEAVAESLGRFAGEERAADELREREHFLRSVLDSFEDVVVVLDNQLRITHANRSAIASSEENTLFGQRCFEVFRWGGAGPCEGCPASRALETGQPAKGEVRLTDPQGEQRVLEVVAFPLFDRTAAIVGAVEHARDVTERKRVEEEARLRERDLLWAQRTAGLGSWSYDIATGHPSWSEGMFLIWGLDPSQPPPHYRDHPKYIHPDDWQQFDAAVEAAATRGEPYELELRLRRPDGSERNVITTCTPELDAEGVVTRLSGTNQDITDMRRAAEQRRQLEAQVLHAQKLESLGVLAGGIAHDFNNLLAGILTNASLAREMTPGDPAVRETLTEIDLAARRAAELTNQMLAYSGRGDFVVASTSVNELLRDVMGLVRASLSVKANLELDLADALPAVRADATQLRQLLMNLLTNASEALEGGNGTISVKTGEVTCDRAFLEALRPDAELPEGRYVMVRVSDDGCGMDEETRRNIFDPFFTTKFTGRGLGLAAVHGIIRGHRGAITVDSQPGEGSCFRVYLPAVDEPVERTQDAPRPNRQWKGAGTILLVDDESNVRRVAKRALEHLGFAVLVAADGAEAVRIFAEHGDAITVVLLDLKMPNMDGEETFHAIRKIRSDVKVLLSSGFTEEDSCSRLAEEGLAGFIQKPYDLSDLRTKLQRALATTGDSGRVARGREQEPAHDRRRPHR